MSELTPAKAPPTPSAKPAPVGTLQRKCACGTHTIAGGECDSCGKKRLQRLASSNRSDPPEVPSVVHDVLRSPGQPLDAATRAFMEPRFAHDFSHVRVHTDARAAESARAVNALAYTVGSDIVFGTGQYAPGAEASRQLIAHELTHVWQQRSGGGAAWQGKLRVGPAADAAEREADQVAARVMAPGGEAIGSPSAEPGPLLRRKCPGTGGGCAGGQWNYEYDGCSVPDEVIVGLYAHGLFIDKNNPAGGEDTHFAKCLPSAKGGRACDRHDECYQTCHTGQGTGLSLLAAKAKCDSQMREDMLSTCATHSQGSLELLRCLTTAEAYHLGLSSALSVPTFLERQLKVCSCELSSPKKGTKESPGKSKSKEVSPGIRNEGAAVSLGVKTYDANVRVNDYVKPAEELAHKLFEDYKAGKITHVEARNLAAGGRNQLLALARQYMSPGAKAFSKAIKEEGAKLPDLVTKYSLKVLGESQELMQKYGLKTLNKQSPLFDAAKYEVALKQVGQSSAVSEKIVKAAGRTGRVVTGLAKVTKALGPIGVLGSLALSAYEVLDAPEDKKTDVAEREISGIAGGTLGFIGGGLIAGWAASLLCGPAAPVCAIIVTIIIEGGAGYLGTVAGEEIHERTSDDD